MKKRVLVLSPIYYPHYGGAEKAIFEICKGISKEYDVDLLTPNFGDKPYEYNGAFNIYRICTPSKFRLIKLIKYQYYQYKKAKELSKKHKYSLIHGHYLLPSGFVGLALKKLLKIPLIITEHHFGTGSDISSEKENPWIITQIMKWLTKKVDHFISTGVTQNKFLEYLGVNKNKIETINLGGDCKVSSESKEKILNKFNLPKNKKIIFSISRLVYRKRYDVLIDAAKKLSKKRKDFLTLIGGKGPEFDNLSKQIKLNKLENYVKLLGFVSEQDLERYRKISDVFVSTSEFEGAGIIYFEAFSAKLPLFAKRNVASEEAIRNEFDGVLFNTSKELSEKLRHYLTKPNILNSIANKGYLNYLHKFNWNNCSKKHLQIFEKLIEE